MGDTRQIVVLLLIFAPPDIKIGLPLFKLVDWRVRLDDL